MAFLLIVTVWLTLLVFVIHQRLTI